MTNICIKEHYDWIDLTKGFAMILVILAHSMEWFSSDLGLRLLILPFIYSFHIPLFFFISGFLFSSDKSFKRFTLRRIKSLLLPYITFAVIILFFDAVKIYILKSNDNIVIKDKMISMLTQNHYNHLWFIIVLFFIEFIAYFICKIKSNGLLITMAVAFVAVAYLYQIYIDKYLLWSLDEVIYAMPFFLSGYIARKVNLQERLLKPKYMLIYLIVGIGANFLNLLLNKSVRYVNMFKCDYGNILLFYISAIAMILFALSLCKTLKNIKPLNYIGKNSLVYYGLHLIVFQFIFHFLQPIFNNMIIEYIVFCLGSTAAVIIVMTAANIVFTKTPLCILIGKSIKRK